MHRDRLPPELVMTPDGRFQDTRPPAPPLLAKIGALAIIVAVIAAAGVVAALALWVAVSVIPIVLCAALIGWVAIKLQLVRFRAFTPRR